MKNRKNTDVKCKFNKNLYNNMNNADDYNYQHCYSYNNYLSKQEFKERGVTIMSLVITIIVLLILAGITIKLALDDNGIIKQSKLASEKYQNKALQEQFALNQAEQEIEKASNGSSSSSSSVDGNPSTGGNSAGGGSGSGSSENTDELKKQIEDLQNEVDSLTAQIQQEKKEKEQLQQQVNGLKKQQNETNATISDLNNQIKDKDNKISDLTKEKESLESQINTLKSNQATGNAAASQVLAGATFSTSNAIGLTGTMKNNGAWTSNSSGNGKITIPLGYHNGKGYVDLSGTYNEAYSKGVTDADNRVNTNSASYKNGYSTGQSVKKCTKIGTIAANNSSGRGTLNVTSILSNYASLSVNNFLLVPTNVSLSFLGGRHNDGQWHSATSGITKSYSGGTLSVSGSASIGDGDNFAWISAYDVYYVD